MKEIIATIPVLPSQDIDRDVSWYEEKTGFLKTFGDSMYAGLSRGGQEFHLQWHADTPDDPLLGGSVVRFFVPDILPFFEEFCNRKTINPDQLRKNTPWGTHEFGFYDLNGNAIFFVQDT